MEACSAGVAIPFDTNDQRHYIKYAVSDGTALIDVKRYLKKKHGKDALSERQIGRIYREFAEGSRVDASDLRCNNRGVNSAVNDENSDWLNQLMCERRDWTVAQLSNEMGISEGSVVTLLHINNYRKINARWTPHQLTDEQRQLRYDAARENGQLFRREPRMLGRII